MSMSFFTFPVPRFLFRGSTDARDDKAHQQARQKEAAKSKSTYESTADHPQLSGYVLQAGVIWGAIIKVV
ncbi:hypothetical protein Pmani_028140 [Petrolisthes manimaculis]|uniref:Uncharacterized protein n=1 Tax=Petrolisthes manimaculis TaxID=1843537 RepID=A0AAE1P0P4_9EUCA|nr:hypothetical protein Pmani_028140 [Petrolisthes manimaculis]